MGASISGANSPRELSHPKSLKAPSKNINIINIIKKK